MLIALICDTAVALLLYDLLRPASHILSLHAALLRIIFVAVMAVNPLNYFGLIAFGKNQGSDAGFNRGYVVALIFFSLHVLVIGYLIFRTDLVTRHRSRFI